MHSVSPKLKNKMKIFYFLWAPQNMNYECTANSNCFFYLEGKVQTSEEPKLKVDV